MLWKLFTIMATLSGWAVLLYNWLTRRPRIKGRIFTVFVGKMPYGEQEKEWLTSFVVYLYLTNLRKNSVHILDYEMEVDVGNGYEELKRVYGVHTRGPWTFSSETHTLDVGDFTDKLIYMKNRPVEYGAPLHGFVVFASQRPKSYFTGYLKFKVICVDAFGDRHKFEATREQFLNLYLLQEMTDIRLKPKNDKKEH